eukprot:691903-Pyramimonas_sp.AAC.1
MDVEGLTPQWRIDFFAQLAAASSSQWGNFHNNGSIVTITPADISVIGVGAGSAIVLGEAGIREISSTLDTCVVASQFCKGTRISTRDVCRKRWKNEKALRHERAPLQIAFPPGVSSAPIQSWLRGDLTYYINVTYPAGNETHPNATITVEEPFMTPLDVFQMLETQTNFSTM